MKMFVFLIVPMVCLDIKINVCNHVLQVILYIYKGTFEGKMFEDSEKDICHDTCPEGYFNYKGKCV